MQIFNPVLILIFIPFFEWVFYPMLHKFKIPFRFVFDVFLLQNQNENFIRKRVQSNAPELKRYLSRNRGVPMASRRGQILLAIFYYMSVLPHAACHCFNSGTISTQAFCFVPMASRRGQSLLAVFYNMSVLPHAACHCFNSGTISTQALCFIVIFFCFASDYYLAWSPVWSWPEWLSSLQDSCRLRWT